MSIYQISGDALSSAYGVLGASLSDVYNISGERIGMDESPVFLDTAIITPLSGSVTASGSKQGACTDGEYIYLASGDVSNYTYLQIVKYKISDGTYTIKQYDGTPNFGHANDMAYNPNNGYVYVCTMQSDGSVIVLDSDNLSYVDTVYLVNGSGNPYSVWQFCFDRETNHFLSVSGNNICVYDQAFNYLSSIPIPTHPDATGQGCETDGTFFYRVTYNPNLIDVIRLSDGTRVKLIVNPMTIEPETMMYDWNGNYYINRNKNGQMFNSVQMFEA